MLDAVGASIAVCPLTGQTAALATVLATDCTLTLGSGVTLTNATVQGGQAEVQCSWTALTVGDRAAVTATRAAAGGHVAVPDIVHQLIVEVQTALAGNRVHGDVRVGDEVVGDGVLQNFTRLLVEVTDREGATPADVAGVAQTRVGVEPPTPPFPLSRYAPIPQATIRNNASAPPPTARPM